MQLLVFLLLTRYLTSAQNYCCSCPPDPNNPFGTVCTAPGTFYSSPQCSSTQCNVGFYCPGTDGVTNCVSPKQCPLGQTSLPGSMSQEDCYSCPAGTSISSPYGGGVCTACPAGQSSEGGTAPCVDCASGRYTPSAGSLCISCSPGRSSAVAAATAPCAPCQPGSFASSFAATSCSPCGAGLYAPMAGATWCAPCPPDTVPNSDASGCTLPSNSPSGSITPRASLCASPTPSISAVPPSSAPAAVPGVATALALSFFGGALATAVLGGLGLALHAKGLLCALGGKLGASDSNNGLDLNAEAAEPLFRR